MIFENKFLVPLEKFFSQTSKTSSCMKSSSWDSILIILEESAKRILLLPCMKNFIHSKKMRELGIFNSSFFSTHENNSISATKKGIYRSPDKNVQLSGC